jgi:uncharacterized protein (TIGR03382 family)
VPIYAVMPVAVGELKFARPNEEAAETGDELQLSVRAYDAYGDELYGAPVEWEVQGAVIDVAGSGQVLHYEYDPAKSQQAIARINDVEIETTFHGYVVDASYGCGCASVGWTSGWPLLLVAAATRRRRSESESDA